MDHDDHDAVIPVARPWMDEQEVEAAGRSIRSGWVTQGPEVAAFEQEFAAYVGAPYACAVSSCTAALHLALLAVDVRPGDEVVTVSHSFIATANSIRYCGAMPVFVDVQPGTFNLDPERLEEAITERTRAIVCVHQLGMPCDLRAILEIARRRRLPVVEDAACAVGSEVRWNNRWERIGKPHGDIACFSFHPRKLVSTGDGGMITTANAEWNRLFRLRRQHGMDASDVLRHRSREILNESYLVMGYNYRLTDIQAAIGREQLRRLPEILERRRALASRYGELLSALPWIKPPEEPLWARSNWQSYCVGLPTSSDQRMVMQRILDSGVATRRGVMCAHREPASHGAWLCARHEPACACPVGTCACLAQSEYAQDHSIILPLFHQMTDAQQIAVVHTLGEACPR